MEVLKNIILGFFEMITFVHNVTWRTKQKDWMGVFIQMIMRLVYLMVVYVIVLGVITLIDQWDMPEIPSEAKITEKFIHKADHYQYQKVGDSTIPIKTHSTYHPGLKLSVKTSDGWLPSSIWVSQSYYDTVLVGQVKKVRYRRGRLIKPFWRLETLNKIFGFGGQAKVYTKEIW